MSNTGLMQLTIDQPNGTAPTAVGPYRLGAKGGRMAEAWQDIWNQLSTTAWIGGLELSREMADKYKLKPISVSEMLCRMRAGGALEQTMKAAPTQYTRKGSTFTAQRHRVHYRIGPGYAKALRRHQDN